MRSVPLFAVLLGVAFTSPASAQLAVDRLWIDFDASSNNRGDVVLRNESEDRYYISVLPSEIVNPGMDDEQRVEIADPEKLGLLVTPNRMVVDPEGMRAIRIVTLGKAVTQDRVYRVKVTPQVGEIQSEAVDPNNRGVSLKLLAAYDLLVTVRPPNGESRLVAERTSDSINIRNDGNTNTLLYEGKLCATNDANSESCSDVGARRMYPGNVWVIPAESGKTILTFMERRNANEEPRRIEL